MDKDVENRVSADAAPATCSLSPFDVNDEVSYYYGSVSREEAKQVLNDAPVGTFLIRDSMKDADQKVLSVKESAGSVLSYKICHKYNNQSHSFYLYGKEDLLFESIPKILEFYSAHFLNESSLIKPAFHHKKAIALFDFLENGDVEEDLYFRKDEILTILEYTQGEEWWKASNEAGQVGLVPVPRIRRLKPNEWPLKRVSVSEESNKRSEKSEQEVEYGELVSSESRVFEKCPFKVRVVEDYTPSPYEHSCMSIKKGQVITVLETKSMGKWYGQLESDGRKGLFPFNRVEKLD